MMSFLKCLGIWDPQLGDTLSTMGECMIIRWVNMLSAGAYHCLSVCLMIRGWCGEIRDGTSAAYEMGAAFEIVQPFFSFNPPSPPFCFFSLFLLSLSLSLSLFV
jgi:hypothetical protein